MGRLWQCLMLVWMLSLGSALAEVAAEKTPSSAEVQSAMEEILTLSAGLDCSEPQAWSVGGNLRVAAQFLIEELKRRGWSVLQSGQLSESYAVVVDPNPDDPSAVVVAGLIPGGTNSSKVFLSQCTMNTSDNNGFSPVLDQRFG